LKTTPRLTIVIGTYKNTFDLVKSTVESMISQSFRNFKMFVIDDNNEVDINLSESVKDYIDSLSDSRIIYLKNKVNIGVPFVFRKWIDLVESEFFMIMGEGDCMMEDSFLNMISFLDKHKSTPCVHGLEINEKGEKGAPLFEKTCLVDSKVYVDSKFLGGRYGWSQASAMYRTEIFKVKNIEIVHDWYWDFYFHCTLLVYSDKIGYLNEYLATRGNDGTSYEEMRSAHYFRINTERIYLGLKFLDEFEFYMINKGYPVNQYRRHLTKLMIKDAIILKDQDKANYAIRLAISYCTKQGLVSLLNLVLILPRMLYKRKY
jgi:hypothetical protein